MNTFTKQHTNLFKGLATLMLLFHHLFYKIEYFEYCLIWSEQWATSLNFIAKTSKVCVSLFLFLSGYGLFKSVSSTKQAVSFKFSVMHIVKILLQLWFIYIIFIPLGYIFGRTFTDIYGSGLPCILYMLTDLTGTSYLLGYYPPANETWWFFGEIIRIYFFFPLFYSGIKRNSILTLIACILLGWRYGLVWFTPFALGMFFAKKDFISLILQQKGWKKVACVAINGLFVVLFIWIRQSQKHDVLFDGFLAIAIIGFLAPLLNPSQIIGRTLTFFGIHSANIFMFHTFIYSKYLHDFIYGFKYPLLIFVILTILCLIISVILELLKKLVHYEKFPSFANATIDHIFSKCNYIKNRVFTKNIIEQT